ncbi:MAG: hypothetical protein JWQ76_3210 [Ramlibacter sp.]|nr:hypothetical protein [Ramlibacter sp.]
MKPSFRLAVLALALAVSAGAHAQLRPYGKSDGAPRGAAPAADPAAAPAAGSTTSPTAEQENAGKLAAQGWLALLDRQDWGTAWDASSAVFRQSVPLGNWMDAIPKVRQPFGPLVEREARQAIYKTSLPGRPDGQYVTVMFASKYQNQQVQEIVTTVRETDGRWRVTGYSPNTAK